MIRSPFLQALIFKVSRKGVKQSANVFFQTRFTSSHPRAHPTSTDLFNEDHRAQATDNRTSNVPKDKLVFVIRKNASRQQASVISAKETAPVSLP